VRRVIVQLCCMAITIAVMTSCGAATPSPSTVPSATPRPTSGPTATPAASPTASATAVGVNGRIAFTWTYPGSDVNNISTIAADGSDERKLTSSHDVMSEAPEWIPGSDRLLFDSAPNDCCHLFTMDAHGNDVRQLSNEGGGYPSISPDGSMIAVDGGPPFGIYVLDAHGANPRRVTTTPEQAVDTLPAFSPDGKRIAFPRFLSGTPAGHAQSAIFVVNTDGSGLQQLTDMATNASYPNWSPDGTRIVFNDNSGNGSLTVAQNVWVMNADGTNLVNLTNTTAGVNWAFGADWSPDGTKIVYISVSTTSRTIAVMNPDGSDSTDIWTAPDRVGIDDPDWGPNQ
jgi:Tol biopolymer transport system component